MNLEPSDALMAHRCLTNMEGYETSEGRIRYEYLFSFPNGFVASVIAGSGAYGVPDAPYEIGVMYDGLGLVHVAGVSDENDIISRNNSEADVLEKLEKIKREI